MIPHKLKPFSVITTKPLFAFCAITKIFHWLFDAYKMDIDVNLFEYFFA